MLSTLLFSIFGIDTTFMNDQKKLVTLSKSEHRHWDNCRTKYKCIKRKKDSVVIENQQRVNFSLSWSAKHYIWSQPFFDCSTTKMKNVVFLLVN